MSDYKMPYRDQNSNKGTFGKVLNVAGSNNYIGAAYLSSASVLKIGAGLVALCSLPKVIDSVSKMLPEAVYIPRNHKIKDFDKYTVLLIGCGLGMDSHAINDFKFYIKLANKYNIPAVIDADGLNIISKLKDFKLPKNTIITPHPAEAARLLGKSLQDILDNLEESAKLLNKKYDCIVVLKTHRTIICNNKELFINQCGNSALAKAGTGDVLAGIIAGLLAQKMEPYEAAKLGVYLHSRAGEIASVDLSEYSVLASDVIKYIPNAIREII